MFCIMKLLVGVFVHLNVHVAQKKCEVVVASEGFFLYYSIC